MKPLLLTATAAFLAIAGAASAMTADSGFTNELRVISGFEDVDSLTPAQVDALKLVIHNGDSAAEKRAAIQSIVNG